MYRNYTYEMIQAELEEKKRELREKETLIKSLQEQIYQKPSWRPKLLSPLGLFIFIITLFELQGNLGARPPGGIVASYFFT